MDLRRVNRWDPKNTTNSEHSETESNGNEELLHIL